MTQYGNLQAEIEECRLEFERISEEYGEMVRDLPDWRLGGAIVPLLRDISRMHHEIKRNPTAENFDESRRLIVDIRATMRAIRRRQRA